MEHAQDWPASVAAQVGQRIAYFRKMLKDGRGRQLTVQALSDRTAELGLPLARPTIAKLENGLRETITVGELHVLAKALNVSPADLVFPIGTAADTEVLPGQRVSTWDAVLWFAGKPEPGYQGVVHLYQIHHTIMQEWRGSWAGPSAERIGVTGLTQVRGEILRRGLLLPPLPPELAYIDDDLEAVQ